MSDFNFRKPLSSQKKNINESLRHINRLYNSTLSAGRVDVVSMELNEAGEKTIGKITFSPYKEGSRSVWIVKGKGGQEIGFITIVKSTAVTTVPNQLYLGSRGEGKLALNLWPEKVGTPPTGGYTRAYVKYKPNQMLSAAAKWIMDNHKELVEEVVVDESKEELKVVKKGNTKTEKNKSSEFNGDKRGMNRFVEEDEVEEVEDVEEEVTEGVRLMAGAETMIKNAGGSSMVSNFRKMKSQLDSKPTGSVIVFTSEKSPESSEIKVYSPSDFQNMVKGLDKKAEAKVGSKGSWSGGEVTVIGMKESVELQEASWSSSSGTIDKKTVDSFLDDLEKAYERGGKRAKVGNTDGTVEDWMQDYKDWFRRAPKNLMDYLKTEISKIVKKESLGTHMATSEAYAHPDEKTIGSFYEKTGKHFFEYRVSKDSWGKSHGLPHEVCVSRKDPSSKGDWRSANVKGTVCYIAVDEDSDGKPVMEKWEIKRHVKYVKAEAVEVETEDEDLSEAYISTEAIKIIRDDLKKEFPKFKFMIARERNSYSSLRVAIVSGPVAFATKHDGTPWPFADINHYYPMNYKNGEILKKILETINKKNWDRSDIQTDYFDVGFYLTVTQGNRSYGMTQRPFTLNGVAVKKPTPVQTQQKVNAIIKKVISSNPTKNAVTGKTHTKSTPTNAGGPSASRYGVFEDAQEVNEKSPPTGPARKFSKDPDVKAAFKKKYGERWKEVMYATAWKMHNK